MHIPILYIVNPLNKDLEVTCYMKTSKYDISYCGQSFMLYVYLMLGIIQMYSHTKITFLLQ